MIRSLLLAAAMLAPPIAAQQAQEIPTGVFVLDAEASDDVREEIAEAVAPMSFLVRRIARGRLRRVNPVYARIEIAREGGDIRITPERRESIVSPASGAIVPWTREDGERLQVSTIVANGKLVQTFTAPDGRRINTFSLDPEGRVLSMHVTLITPRLPQPLTYTLRYRRVDGRSG